MALDSTEQELFDFAWQAMPEWFRARERAQEELAAFAKIFGSSKKVMAHWFDMAMIGTATGPDSIDPDWLEFHAEDRGTRRRAGETDAVMRARLRFPPDAVTRQAILAATSAMLSAAGVSGEPSMVEFPRDAAYLGTYAANTGTGVVFSSKTDVGSVMTLLPTVPFAYPPWFGDLSGRVRGTTITLSGATSSGNDGTFAITGLVGMDDGSGSFILTGLTYVNVNGVAEVDSGCAWEISRLDHHGAVMDGHARAYCDRGYRCWRGQSIPGEKKAIGGFVVTLPHGTTDGTKLAIAAMIRQMKAAGFKGLVERRIGAP